MISEAPPRGPIILSDEQRIDWLRLYRSENVGPITFIQLINRTGSARNALQMLPAMAARGGKAGIAICPRSDAEKEIAALHRLGGRLVALGEAGYPPHLRHIHGAPPLISVIGAQRCLASKKVLAIVGARNASMSGCRLATQLSKELSEAGFVIVSGLARGIDRAAHEAALAGGTVAIFAGGIDYIYPHTHNGLMRAIIDAGGAVLTDMPLGHVPRARDFPRRNRIISGMALGALLIEAAQRSGSLHTARFALEQNREVFAVPGFPADPRFAGCNMLLKQGATLVTGAEDVLDVLAMRPDIGRDLEPPEHITDSPEVNMADMPDMPQIDDDARLAVLSALAGTPEDIDALIRFCGVPARLVHIALLELELAGRIERLDHGRVALSDNC